ncbi:NUDIX domain-containing protein [Mucilaginibacter sp.]
MADIQILDKQTLSNKKYLLESVAYQQFTQQGEAEDKKAEVYYRPDAAAVLVYNAEKQVFLLAKQFRLPAYLNGSDTGYLTEACAGLIDEGETPEQTAIREAEEELGYRIGNVTPCGHIYSSAGGITEKVYLFTASYTEHDKVSAGGGAPGEGENITLVELHFADARRMLEQAEIIDAKTLMLLQHFFLFLYKGA